MAASAAVGHRLADTWFRVCGSLTALYINPSEKQKVDETAFSAPTKSNPATMKDLPPDVVRNVFSFLPLEDMWSKREVCKTFLTMCNTDSRWIPVIPPDCIKNEIMTLEKHGKILRWMYLVKYRKWMTKWHYNKDRDALLAGSRSKLYDGYFSLAPWRHFKDFTSYPQPWLHRMVHCQSCPTTLPAQEPKPKRQRLSKPAVSNNLAVMQLFEKSPNQTWKKWKATAGNSSFFQCRLRDSEIVDLAPEYDGSSDIYTTPIQPFIGNGESCLKNKTFNIILQPVDLRNLDNGKKHDRLPDHNMAEFKKWSHECSKILECYFGSGSVMVAPLIHHSTKLFYGRNGTVRKEKEGLLEPGTTKRVMQFQAEALQGLGATVLKYVGNGHTSSDAQETLILYIVAPHVSCVKYSQFPSAFVATPTHSTPCQPFRCSKRITRLNTFSTLS
jgi:hypothetical protein